MENLLIIVLCICFNLLNACLVIYLFWACVRAFLLGFISFNDPTWVLNAFMAWFCVCSNIHLLLTVSQISLLSNKLSLWLHKVLHGLPSFPNSCPCTYASGRKINFLVLTSLMVLLQLCRSHFCWCLLERTQWGCGCGGMFIRAIECYWTSFLCVKGDLTCP